MTGRKKLRVADYIEHIIEAIARIETYVKDIGFDEFIENSLITDAVVRNFEIIGEAANNITVADSEFTQQHPDLQLNEAYQMRNALAHGYYTVNLLTVWNTIRNNLPLLKKQMLDIQATLPRISNPE